MLFWLKSQLTSRYYRRIGRFVSEPKARAGRLGNYPIVGSQRGQEKRSGGEPDLA
jgi:hypothetical protein